MGEPVDFDNKKELIKHQPVFSQLTDGEIDVLADLLIEIYCEPGNVIVKQGDPVDSVYLIVSGTCDVNITTYPNNLPETKKVAVLGPKEAIGLSETGFYSLSGIRTATVIANSEMVLLKLNVAAFHGFALAYSHVSDVMRKIADSVLKNNA